MRRFLASTFNTGLLEQREDRSWGETSIEVLPEARSCLGMADACGFVHEVRRYGALIAHPADGVFIIPDGCNEPIVWSPSKGCARRVGRPSGEPKVTTGRREGRFLTLVGPEAVLLELVSPVDPR